MSETESVINFYLEYQEIKKDAMRQDLIDVLGFLDNDLEPSNSDHIYHRLMSLEDRYIITIRRLQNKFHHNVPCIKNFLMVDLGYKNAISPVSESEKVIEK